MRALGLSGGLLLPTCPIRKVKFVFVLRIALAFARLPTVETFSRSISKCLFCGFYDSPCIVIIGTGG
jgi:hypothetical protein